METNRQSSKSANCFSAKGALSSSIVVGENVGGGKESLDAIPAFVTPGDKSLGVTALHSTKLPSGCYLVVSSGSVVNFAGDAIVNAANEGCLGGGGVDGAINTAGGKALQIARQELPILDKRSKQRCPTGGAVATVGGKLLAPLVIHAVGPNYLLFPTEKADKLLGSAYANAIKVAQSKGVKKIGFSLLSAGVYRGSRSLKDVLRIGAEAIILSACEDMQAVYLVAFSAEESATLVDIVKQLEVHFSPRKMTEELHVIKAK